MSFPPSETSTLLPSPPPEVDVDDDDPNVDVPIHVDSFLRHVRRKKLFFGPALLLVLATEVMCTLLVFGDHEDGIRGVVLGEKILSVGGVATLVVLCLIYTLSLFRPVSRNVSRLAPLEHLKLHRTLCYATFYGNLLLLLFHPAPWIAHLVVTHRSPPPTTNDIFYAKCARAVCLVLAMAAAGTIRRGPKLHAHRMKLPTGFGINKEAETIPQIKLNDAPDELLGARREPEQNVFDYTNCSLLNFVFLTYLASLARRSLEVDQLNINDLPELETHVRNAGVEADRHRMGSNEKVTQWGLLKSVWGSRIHVIYISLFLESVKTSLGFLRTVALHEIVMACSQPEGWDKSYAYLMCIFLAVGRFAEDFLIAYLCVRESYLLHMPVRITLDSMLFSKILRSTDAKAMEAHHTAGDSEDVATKGRSQVMNLMTIDAGTIASLGTKAWDLTNAFLNLIVATFYLWVMLGISAFVGIICIPLATPLSWLVAKAIYRCDKKLAAARDARTSAFKEYLVSVKVIKLNALEEHYKRRITHLRRNEVYWQRWRYTLGTVFNVLSFLMPVTNVIITFAFHTKVMKRPLDPATAFVTYTVLYRVKDALNQVPAVLNKILETKVALGRIVGFLNQPEIVHQEPLDPVTDIVITGASFTWPQAENVSAGSETQIFCLRDVNLKLPVGGLTLVCGALGSGKSLLAGVPVQRLSGLTSQLRALLGEATVLYGRIDAPHTDPGAVSATGSTKEEIWSIDTWLTDSIAYAPQQSYIRHGTIRDNILFGCPMWRSRYEEVLRQTSLLPDLEILSEHDLTEVGEYGVNLSGGQKARINLARCLYSRAKTIYLDDILSAVDAHTAQYIVDECLRGRLLRGRTCLLVTHHVDLCLPAAHYVVVLNDSRVEKASPASEISHSDIPFQVQIPDSPQEAHSKETGSLPEQGMVSRQIYQNEHRESGRVASSHYWLIVSSAGGSLYWTFMFGLLIGHRAIDYWQIAIMRSWTGDPDLDHLNGHLIAYSGTLGLMVLVDAARWIWLYGIGNSGFTGRMCQRIHDLLLDNLLRAPLGWYESTPSGRIMNVVGYDMWNIDAVTPDAVGRTLMTGDTLFMTPTGLSADVVGLQLGVYISMTCIETPVVIWAIIGVSIPLYFIGERLTKLRADLKRLSATSSSPLITVYHDAIDGVIMIRAFGTVNLMKSIMRTFLSRERKTAEADWSVYNWVRAIVLATCSIVVSATAFALVQQEVSGPQAGFILAFAIPISSTLFSMLQQYSELDRNFVHAERINQYIQMPDQEPEGGLVPATDWPSAGAVKITDLCVRYADDLPEVLHHVSLDIEPGMRVGLVGSTGSGKSTLALALFRGITPHRGKVDIDGIDIATLDLKELRGRLNMVVQDGSLSSGTLRDALDVTGLKDDREIYEALRRVHLLPDPSDPGTADCPFANLDTFVAVEGANFSQGQRQLLCLARALLKHSKILVMDEATSSVDFEMDAKITQTIQECFAGTTMLVIAHRLATIMHYDRVAVLDRGRVVEYAAPLELMQRRDSAFRRLCMAQGEQEFDKLLAMAKGSSLLD